MDSCILDPGQGDKHMCNSCRDPPLIVPYDNVSEYDGYLLGPARFNQDDGVALESDTYPNLDGDVVTFSDNELADHQCLKISNAIPRGGVNTSGPLVDPVESNVNGALKGESYFLDLPVNNEPQISYWSITVFAIVYLLVVSPVFVMMANLNQKHAHIIKKHAEDRKKLTDFIKTMKEKMDETNLRWQGEVNKLQDSIALLRYEKKECQDKVEVLLRSNSSLDERMKRCDQETFHLTNKIKNLHRSNGDLQVEKDKCFGEVSGLMKQFEVLQGSYSSLQDHKIECFHENSDLKKMVKTFEESWCLPNYTPEIAYGAYLFASTLWPMSPGHSNEA